MEEKTMNFHTSKLEEVIKTIKSNPLSDLYPGVEIGVYPSSVDEIKNSGLGRIYLQLDGHNYKIAELKRVNGHYAFTETKRKSDHNNRSLLKYLEKYRLPEYQN